MRNSFSVSFLVVLLLGCALFLTGCGFFNQPGKTAQEVNREHRRMLRINQQEMMQDIDKALLLDQPSKLTDMKLP